MIFHPDIQVHLCADYQLFIHLLLSPQYDPESSQPAATVPSACKPARYFHNPLSQSTSSLSNLHFNFNHPPVINTAGSLLCNMQRTFQAQQAAALCVSVFQCISFRTAINKSAAISGLMDDSRLSSAQMNHPDRYCFTIVFHIERGGINAVTHQRSSCRGQV